MERPLSDDRLAELKKLAADHFEVRTRLRMLELEHIERELARLKETVDQLRKDLDRRNAERDAIIERRVKEISTGDRGGW